MSPFDALKEKIKQALPDLDYVIGWQQGFDSLHATPLFMRTPEDVDRLIWNPLCVHNLSTYLPSLKGKKVGIVLKGCDSRGVIELLQENLVERENLVLFGMPCSGVVDLTKIRRKVGDLERVSGVTIDDAALVATTPEGEVSMPRDEIAADKCLVCQFHNAIEPDHFEGDPLPPSTGADLGGDELAMLEAMAPAELMTYWAKQMERCIRCYACRNACPMCVCRDHCIAQSRDPHWLTQEDTPREKLMFQLIHTMHLAGRCIQCGECQRACPVDIPILALRRKMDRVIRELFDYQAGLDAKATPPLSTFQVEEANIKERRW
ncbi:4Fe-4S ferredoxin, iron-sulpur binding domain-containing protein [Desulfovibrio sp. X2]|uniref:4Fe-4S dicluster domain-containing protein n=1 Tax=Desulfovibrio sp. X2 TaxID=941449 RepID=UPI000358C8E2|nr:4Fe-4S dicluster domain-containing protein [Desulfovibrio sp. X2]EPR44346.1 4Fe-4S ferredoxin, iron-sulpur binding domain-containing protein [Desulfovibrio sp. X2]